MVSLFPGLIVAAAVVTLLPDSAPLRTQAALFFDRVLPPDVSPILESYFENGHPTAHSSRVLVVTGVVSLLGASGLIVTLMEGFRRAFDLPPGQWGFWDKRLRSFALVPIALVPLMVASAVVIFGQAISGWIAVNIGPSARTLVLLITFVVRWTLAVVSSIGVIAVTYHMGVPPSEVAAGEDLADRSTAKSKDQLWAPVRTFRAMSTMESSWRRTLPGATLATAMWFLTTLIFGWYVTRFANYSEVYGSLGAGIALLFWLYIISLSVLAGAEFNAQLFPANRGVVAQGDHGGFMNEAGSETGNETAAGSGQGESAVAQTRIPG